MNAKQSLKLVVKENERLVDFNRSAAREIKALNVCIDSVIAGEKTFCDWCEDENECQRECKSQGCSEWWLKMDHGVQSDEHTIFTGQPIREGDADGENDLGEGILQASTPG